MGVSYCNDGRCERVRKGEIHPIHDLRVLEEERKEALHELVNSGSALTGATLGVTLGFAAGGPPGAVLGAFIGTSMGRALKNIGDEVIRRYLGPRERIRVGAVFTYGLDKIRKNFEDGKEIRMDEFLLTK